MMLPVAAAVLSASLYAVPAQAGFEWSPPPAVTTTPEGAPVVPAAPTDHVDMMELTPAPVEGAAAPAPAIERENSALPTPPPEALATPPAAGSFANVVGFGAEIPLALALGQIVPAEFSYSFAANVNPGLRISWDGGKPWNEVLNTALAPHNLRADVTGTSIIVCPDSVSTQSAVPVNASAAPLKQGAVPYNTTPRPPADAAPAVSGASHTAVTGEGSGNYPRRTPSRSGFFSSIFTDDEDKGNMAPRPPVGSSNVLVRNEVAPEDMSTVNAEIATRPLSAAPVAAAVEPAAPAVMAPLPSQAPIPLNTARISYADEEARQRTDILPQRTLSEAPRAQQNSVLDPFQVKFWQADTNANLREVLNGWAEQAGVEVIWDSGYDYKLPGSVNLHGTFPEAVTRLFDLYGVTEPRPQGKLHPNLPKGPSVLLVENYP